MPDNMPEQLRRQVEEAERIRAAMAAANGQQPQPGQPPNQQPPVQEPPSQDDEGDEDEDEGEGEDGEDESDEARDQRLRSLQGRYDSLMKSNQALTERINELSRGITKAKTSQSVDPAPAQPKEVKKLVSTDEENEYGKEFFDVVGRRAQEAVDPFFSEFDSRLRRLEGRQDATVKVMETTAQQGMMQMLGAQVPNWKEINHHPDFHAWLAQFDPYSGRQLKDMLLEAFHRQEARRVVSFFQGFLAEATGNPQEPQARTSSAPPLASPNNGQGNGSGKPSLADYAAPGRARSAPQTLPPEKSTYTRAQVQRLSDEKRRGLWRGREVELEAIERDIFQAQHEGRLLP